MKPPGQSRLLRVLVVSILAGVALYAVTLAFSDLQAVGEAASSLGILGWSLVLGLSLANYALRFVRWQGYLELFGRTVPVGLSALYYLGGFAFTTTPGKAGEAVRSLVLKKHAVTYAESLAAVFVERLADVVAMVLLSVLAIFAFQQTRIPVLVLTVAVLLLLPMLRSSRLDGWLEIRRRKLGSKRIQGLLGQGLRLLRQSARLLRNRPLYSGLGIGLIAWGAEGVGLWLILDLMAVEISVSLAVGIYAVSVLIGALSFIPGGLGSTEAAMGLMLTLAGTDLVTAVSATLICRLATLWFAVVIGLGCLALLKLRHTNRRLGIGDAETL